MDAPLPPTLSYRSAGGRPGPTGVDLADVANGFLSAFVAVPLAGGAVAAGVLGHGVSLAIVGLAVAVVAVGVVRGLRRGRWGFSIGVGLFVGLAAGLAGVVVWVARG